MAAIASLRPISVTLHFDNGHAEGIPPSDSPSSRNRNPCFKMQGKTNSRATVVGSHTQIAPQPNYSTYESRKGSRIEIVALEAKGKNSIASQVIVGESLAISCAACRNRGVSWDGKNSGKFSRVCVPGVTAVRVVVVCFPRRFPLIDTIGKNMQTFWWGLAKFADFSSSGLCRLRTAQQSFDPAAHVT